ncbi:EEF1A lysine methyltransferase 1 isoform X2 [Linepithema humile]|nr:PREDICTED: protein-lysine N-methyltransferase N6amt2 isoform X2 [Linepithema humile]XP_012232054.1 PREDICTED: protein-lysine N-methyltransferase N6amt2 isoform X2 [Linepithema humile]XP_012232055.1 PREDICTED: protein-lysine N-methyltransferase N6amt2 isoform X2 [Linepithema humile]
MSENMDSDDDQPRLSSSTLAALQEFLREKEERKNLLKRIAEEDRIPNALFEEDWQLSQFWYDDKTIEAFTKGALNSTPANGKIALISCPSLYSKLKKECEERQIVLFEYDSRFNIFGGDFLQYDYKFPLDVPRDMSSEFDLVIADPPFLSEECLTKTAVTIKFLAKKNIVLCTGAVMAELAERLLNVKKCDIIPGHKNNLANEFYCYSNFNFDQSLSEQY